IYGDIMKLRSELFTKINTMKKTLYSLISALLIGSMSVFMFTNQAHATATVIFITSGTTWTVPSDWNSSNNTIEAIGGGGGGADGSGSNVNGAGGAGGDYAKVSNV